MAKPTATIEKQVILTFSLPGVHWQERTGSHQEAQLEQHGELWRLKVNAQNVAETAKQLREVVTELERFAANEREYEYSPGTYPKKHP